MSKVDRAGLGSFLLQEARNDVAKSLIAGAMARLEPYFLAAEAGRFELGPAEEVPREVLRTALSAIRGRESEVAVFSLSRPLDQRPEWMSEETYRKLADRVIGRSVWRGIAAIFFKEERWQEITGSSSLEPSNLGSRMKAAFETCLWDGLRQSFGDHPNHDLTTGLWATIYYFLAFTLLGDLKLARSFGALLVPGHVLAGSQRGETGVWIVFAR